MTRSVRMVLLAFCLTSLPELSVEAQTTGFELDHFFVGVNGSEEGSERLAAAGFKVSRSHPHPGQGTASRGIVFENAYLELIWLTDGEEAASPTVGRTKLKDRLELGSGVCPFGVGLRAQGEGAVDLPFETWEYRPPYLPEGMAFRMAGSSEDLFEPLVFFLPWLSGPTGPPPNHPNGASKVTNLEITLTGGASESATVSALSRSRIASFRQGSAYFMDVELDGG